MRRSAVRFDATADRLVRSTNVVNYNSVYSWAGWFYITDVTGNRALFAVGTDSFFANYDEWRCAFGALDCKNNVGNASAGSLSSLTWTHIAGVREGPAIMRGYINGVLAVTDTSSVGTGRTTPNRMEMGGFTTSNVDMFDGRVASFKLWDAALTIEEIRAEMWRDEPVRRRGLNGSYQFNPGARTIDSSGLARHWTASGTLTDEAGPPLLSIPRRRIVGKAGSATGSALGTAAGAATTSLAGASQGAGALGSAAGAATASLTGKSNAAGALGSAAGTATTSLPGTGQVPAAIDAAAGVASTGLTSSATAATALGSAAGSAAASLFGAAETNASTGTAAGLGVASLAGQATASTALDAAAGVATTALTAKSNAATALDSATGTATASLVGASATDGQSAINTAVGAATTGLAGSSQVAANLSSATGSAATSLEGAAAFAATLTSATASATTALAGASVANADITPAAGLAITSALTVGTPTTNIGEIRALFTAARPEITAAVARPSIRASATAPRASFSTGV